MNDAAYACHICTSLEQALPENTVIRTANWCVTGVKDSPGHLMVTAVTHDAGIAGLSPEAAADLGPLIQKLSAGLLASGAFTRTSFIHLGDAAPHTHFMLIGRAPGDLPVVDAKPLGARVVALQDAERARTEIAELRTLLTLG